MKKTETGAQQLPVQLLRRLREVIRRRLRPRRLRFIKQNTTTDCAAACLAMVLDWHGRQTPQDDVRKLLEAGRDGASAFGIISIAKQCGLRGQGVAIDLEDLQYLETGTILHWGFDHFVVFDRLNGNGAIIVDPAIGRRTVSRRELDKKFTGVAIVFEPTGQAQQAAARKGRTWSYVRDVLLKSRFLPRVLAITLLVQLLGLTLPILTETVVDSIIPNSDVDLVTIFIFGSMGLAVFMFLLLFIRSHLLLFLRIDLDRRMTQEFMAHVLRLPLPFFHTRKSGDLLMRLNSNAAAREIVTSSAISATFDGVLVVSYLIILLAMNLTVGSVAAVLGLLRVSVFWFSRLRVRALMAERLVNQADANSYQIQMLEGIETLKAAGAEDRAYDHWSGLYIDVLNVAIRQGRLDALTQSLIGMLGFASPLIILATGALMTINGSLSLGSMLGLTALANGFLFPLASLVNVGFKLQQLETLVQRINDILETPLEPTGDPSSETPVLRGSIAVDDVTFKYPGADRNVLENVSFRIEPGSKVAICGRSGAGKSTLGHVLLGLYRPTKGKVFYDGLELGQFRNEDLRRQVGVAIQQNLLFYGTIRDNIALVNPSLSLSDVEAAAKLAQIHDEIIAMPMQYNTVVSGSGSMLSGGQVQRIAIARALSNNPAVLLLDEATSALDTETEKVILEKIHSHYSTVITITHRISVLRRAETILVMDKGRIVEAGKHKDLIGNNGVYASLVRAGGEH